jgi:hypothetical protein
VRGRLHDEDLAGGRPYQVARFAESGRDRLHGSVAVPADGAVVGVGDEDGSVVEGEHAERVLQQRVGGRPVDQPEVEQPLPDDGVHRAVLDVAQRAGLRVGDPQPVTVRRKAGRLGEPGLRERPVAQRLDRGAGVHPGRPLDRVEPPQLVDPGHRDDDQVVVPGEVPG